MTPLSWSAVLSLCTGLRIVPRDENCASCEVDGLQVELRANARTGYFYLILPLGRRRGDDRALLHDLLRLNESQAFAAVQPYYALDSARELVLLVVAVPGHVLTGGVLEAELRQLAVHGRRERARLYDHLAPPN